MTKQQLLYRDNELQQSLESMFAETYADVYADEDDFDGSVKRLLYYDLDEQKFGLYDDEQGSYRSAFEQQNNVQTIGYVRADDVFTRSISEFIEAKFWQE